MKNDRRIFNFLSFSKSPHRIFAGKILKPVTKTSPESIKLTTKRPAKPSTVDLPFPFSAPSLPFPKSSRNLPHRRSTAAPPLFPYPDAVSHHWPKKEKEKCPQPTQSSLLRRCRLPVSQTSVPLLTATGESQPKSPKMVKTMVRHVNFSSACIFFGFGLNQIYRFFFLVYVSTQIIFMKRTNKKKIIVNDSQLEQDLFS